MTDNLPLFSIAIPTYNRLPTLQPTLNSALAQTYVNLEIIILDNHSDDGTDNYLQHMARQFSQIKLIRHASNIGMLANIRHIPEIIQGKYFLILSDDDSIHPDLVSTAVKQLEAHHDASLWYCRVKCIDRRNGGKKLSFTPQSPVYQSGHEFLDAWLYQCRIGWALCGLVYRSAIVRQYNALQGTTIFFDICSVVVCALNHNILYSNRFLANYIIHSAGASKQHSIIEDVKIIKQTLRDIFSLRLIKPQQRKFLNRAMTAFACSRTLSKITYLPKVKAKQILTTMCTIMAEFHWNGCRQLLRNFTQFTKLLDRRNNKKAYLSRANIKKENYSHCPIAYEYDLLENMVSLVCASFKNHDHISLSGQPVFVIGGKLLAEHIQQLYVDDGLPKADVVINEQPGEKSLSYRRADLFVQRLLQSNWGQSLKQQPFYQQGLTLRLRKLRSKY